MLYPASYGHLLHHGVEGVVHQCSRYRHQEWNHSAERACLLGATVDDGIPQSTAPTDQHIKIGGTAFHHT